MSQYPEFVENTQYYKMGDGQNAEAQMAAMLENIKRVFNLNQQYFSDFDELVSAHLNAGLEIFGLETGIVSHVIEGTYSVVDVVSDLGVINRGDEFPLEGTYCNEVFKCGSVLGLPHVGRLPYMKDHPVYVNLKLEAYLSAPIYVDDEMYGTLNFTSTRPRADGFSQHERDLIVMMADAIGNFLLLRDREQRLKKFVGFVAHDLRGPLGTIASMAKMGAHPGVPESRQQQILARITNISNVTLEFVHSVLNIAALGTGKLEADCRSTPVQSLVDFAVDNLRDAQELKSANLHLELEEGVSAFCDQNLLHQVFANLLMNAIKYSPEDGSIDVKINSTSDDVFISIVNEISEATEPDLGGERYKSVGFGLDIVNEILAAHDRTLDIEEGQGLFAVRFRLPKGHL